MRRAVGALSCAAVLTLSALSGATAAALPTPEPPTPEPTSSEPSSVPSGGPSLPAGAEPTAPPDQEPSCGADEASQWIPRDNTPFVRLGVTQVLGLPQARVPITVAVVDAGVTAGNPHLDGALLPTISLVQPEPSDSPDAQRTRQEHGTQIAAMIAGRDLRPGAPSNLVGVDPTALVQPVEFYTVADSEVPANRLTPDTLAAGIRAAVESGARVVNVSFSDSVSTPDLEAAVAEAVAAGVLVVASAGNDRTDGARFPAAYPGVLSVAAVDTADVVPADSPQSDTVDLAAPGNDVIGVSPGRDCRLLGAGDPVSSSWATAYVSGAAALVWSFRPDATAEEIAYRLTAGADRPQRGARDDAVGWGIVQPYASVTMTIDPNRPGPPLPGQAAPTPPPVQVEPILVARTTDPLADARRDVVRWALVGLAALGLLLLLTRWNRTGGRR